MPDDPPFIADAHNDLLMELVVRRHEPNPFGRYWLPPLRAGGVRLQVVPVYSRPRRAARRGAAARDRTDRRVPARARAEPRRCRARGAGEARRRARGRRPGRPAAVGRRRRAVGGRRRSRRRLLGPRRTHGRPHLELPQRVRRRRGRAAGRRAQRTRRPARRAPRRSWRDPRPQPRLGADVPRRAVDLGRRSRARQPCGLPGVLRDAAEPRATPSSRRSRSAAACSGS